MSKMFIRRFLLQSTFVGLFVLGSQTTKAYAQIAASYDTGASLCGFFEQGSDAGSGDYSYYEPRGDRLVLETTSETWPLAGVDDVINGQNGTWWGHVTDMDMQVVDYSAPDNFAASTGVNDVFEIWDNVNSTRGGPTESDWGASQSFTDSYYYAVSPDDPMLYDYDPCWDGSQHWEVEFDTIYELNCDHGTIWYMGDERDNEFGNFIHGNY